MNASLSLSPIPDLRADGLQTARAGGFQTPRRGELRIAARFTLDRAQSIHTALRDAAQTIDRMPSTFMTYPMGDRILPVERGSLTGAPSTVVLDTGYLGAFGGMRVPGRLWRGMRRNAAWIEPTLISAWMRLMRDYAAGQGRQLAEDKMFAAMQWSDPARDGSRVREIALSVLEAGNLRCTWTDRPLGRNTLDIDHMFPWTAWPCSDFWKPATRPSRGKPAPQAGPAAIRDHVVPCGGQDHQLVGAGVPEQGREPLTRAVLLGSTR